MEIHVSFIGGYRDMIELRFNFNTAMVMYFLSMNDKKYYHFISSSYCQDIENNLAEKYIESLGFTKI